MKKVEKASPEKNLIFKLQSELSLEKSKNFQLSKELFELKLELAKTKNNLRNLEIEISTYKSKEKNLQSTIQSLESQLTTNISKNTLPIKDLKKNTNFASEIYSQIEKSPQTKIIFTPFIGKSYDPKDDLDNFSQESSEDSFNYDIVKSPKNLFKGIKSNNKLKIGGKIFEDFLIIGAESDQIINSLNEAKGLESTTVNIAPKILYSFNNNLKSDHITTILNCAFPFGIECKKLKITDSFSSLNEILFTSNTLFEQRDHSFVFVLKCDEDIEKEINYQYKVSLDSRKKLRRVSLLQTSNPNHLKYCICFIANDYQHFTYKAKSKIKDSKKINMKNNVSTLSTNDEESYFYSTKKIFCFVSYYPFIKFFTDVIISILNYLKLNKMKFSHEKEEYPPFEIFQKIDASFLHHQMNKELELILKNIYENQIPCFSSTLIFPNFDDLKGMIEFKIPQESHCFFLEAEWLSSCVFSNLKCEQFLYLFLALMLEKTLVVFSENLALLTSTLMTFICLLKPFKWPYPMVFNIPENLLEFLDSPVPILIGINQGKKFFIERKLEKMHKECIFVNLDEVEIFNDFNLDEEVYSQFFHQLAYKLKGPFDDLKNKKEGGKKIIIMNPDKNDKEICLKIFEIIKESLNKEIIQLIKGNKILLKKNIEVEEILKSSGSKDGFIKRFFQTQMFSYFINNIK